MASGNKVKVNPLMKMLHAKKADELVEDVDVETKPKGNEMNFSLAPLVQVEMFLAVLITPGNLLSIVINLI